MERRDTNEPERFLEHLATPAARPEFKARLRDAFVNAESTGEIDVDAALATLEPPAARPEFKEELRARFVGAGAGGAVDPPKPARASRRRLRLVAGGLGLAAAAALILVFLRPSDAALDWVIERSVALGLEQVQVDAQPLPAGTAPDDLARSLREAREISTGSTPLTLRLADQFVVLMDPESTLEIGALTADPARWQLHGRRGAFRVRTGPGYDPQARLLHFTTPHSEIEAHGTIFGIDIDPSGTCACCLQKTLKGSYRRSTTLDVIPDACSLYLSASPSVAPRMCSKAPHLPALRVFEAVPVAWP